MAFDKAVQAQGPIYIIKLMLFNSSVSTQKYENTSRCALARARI